MAADQNSTQTTLGEFLRQERERRGITIEQVASATKISIRLLHLLESDQYVELPAKPFIRGFVNSYCRFVGMDSKEVLIRYGSFLEERSHERPTRDEGHSGYAFEKPEGEQSRTMLGIVMVAFIVIGGLAFAVLKPQLKRHHNSHADKLRDANESPSPEVSASPGVSVEVIPVPSVLPSVLIFTPSPSPSPSPSPCLSPVIATTEIPMLLRPLKEPINVAPTPSPSFSPIAAPAPSVTPKPSPSPSPSPKPSPRAAPSATATPTPSPTESGKPDALNSGVNLKPSEIKYKVVLKAGSDVWVRYQVDERPKMKFILRVGKVLVLRAQKGIRFQTSQPDGVTFRVNGGPERPMIADSNAAMRGKDLTLFFPKEAIETTQEPFPGERALLGAFMPVGKGGSPSPSATH